MWQLISTITRKELTDNFRDRRSVFNALLSVLLNPLIYIAMFGFLNRAFSEQAERALQLPVQGADNAPNLIAYLDQQNVDILPAPDDIETAILEGDVDVVLVIPDNFGETFTDGRQATVEVWQDSSNQGGGIIASRTERLLQRYSQQVGSLRLLARGISPTVVNPIPVQEVDVSPEEPGIGGSVLALLPVIMLTAAFLGGFYMVTDMTAGERERESLEPLLINPVPRSVFVLGKYLTGLLFTIFATALATGFFLILLVLPFVQEFTGIRIEIGLAETIGGFLIILPVVLMAVALQMLIASYTKNVKEAQTYTQLLSLAGFLPALMLSILPIRQAAWMIYVPTIGHLFLINELARGEAVAAGDVITATLVALGITAVALGVAMRLYNREQIALIG